MKTSINTPLDPWTNSVKINVKHPLSDLRKPFSAHSGQSFKGDSISIWRLKWHRAIECEALKKFWIWWSFITTDDIDVARRFLWIGIFLRLVDSMKRRPSLLIDFRCFQKFFFNAFISGWKDIWNKLLRNQFTFDWGYWILSVPLEQW